MTDSIKVKMSHKGFYALRRDPAVVKELERRGRAIMNYANRTLSENSLSGKIRDRRTRSVGYRMASYQGRKVRQGRWFVNVYAATNHAKYSNAKHNTLIRALNETQRPSPEAADLQPGKHP